MEHRCIEYTVRARLGRHQWMWTIYVKDAPAITNQLIGTRDEAIADADGRDSPAMTPR
jgi:hypothetical protein